MSSNEILSDLTSIVGKENVSDRIFDRVNYSQGRICILKLEPV